ncbi:MAG: hypothetical protein JZU65_02565 [Chlorobium sp.]|nr:hypothetical protein [Chlorobium sp.]
MTDLIGPILVSSIHNLFEHQPDVLTNTSATGMTEWNLGHHLANEIAKYIFWLNHDLDVVKRNHHNQRPDIIFHIRGSNSLNFLVVEIKCHNDNKNDLRKIKEDWMGTDLHYRYGASVLVKSATDFNLRIFENGTEAPRNFTPQSHPALLPIPNKDSSFRFDSLIDRIKSEVNILIGTSDDLSVGCIDHLIAELYESKRG